VRLGTYTLNVDEKTSNSCDFDRDKIIPLGRMRKSEEVADLVEFLLRNKSTYITGEYSIHATNRLIKD
jgi:NAD(P)-dependent dehydrogenase (short-subunit alcohol dehydrogenase family)